MLPGFPSSPPFKLPEIKTPAEWAFETVRAEVEDFQKGLQPHEGVGVLLASFGSTVLLAVETIGLQDQFFVIHGLNAEGESCRLLQHFSQFSLLLKKVPIAEERRPIGFVNA